MRRTTTRLFLRSCAWGACALTVVAASAATTVDVLIAYDRSAAVWLAAEGGDVKEFAESAVAAMNESLAMTDLDTAFSFRLAGSFVSAAEAVGTQSDKCLENALTSVCDGRQGRATGAWKDVQEARDRCKADIVAMLIDARRDGSSGLAGLSWKLGADGKPAKVSNFAKFAYVACDVRLVDGNSGILLHEVGHVMGAGHSERLESDPGPQQFPYSSAFYFIDGEEGKFTTVMGYQSRTTTDRGYEVLPCFSSSSHTWNGLPLGDATHDNTRTLRETCSDVARFRVSGNEGGGTAAAPAAFPAKTVVNGTVRDSDGALFGIVQLTVTKTDKNGFSKVSGAFIGLDGKKLAVKAVKASVTASASGAEVSNVSLLVKGSELPLLVTICSDGALDGAWGARRLSCAKSVGTVATARPRFVISGIPDTLDGFPVLSDVMSGGVDYHLLPDGEGAEIDAGSGKWKLAKAAGVKYKKNKTTKSVDLVVDVGKDGAKTNLSALKLSLTAKTGVFKGSFTVYADAGMSEKPKLKKYKFNVTGIVADGEGVGVAVCKKTSVTVSAVVR